MASGDVLRLSGASGAGDELVICEGSGGRVGLSVGQQRQEAGFARPNVAVDVACRACGRRFPRARVTYTDHGIPTAAQALVPRHRAVTS